MRGDKSQRAWIYALVGVYLLYTAWQLFQGLGESEGNQAVIVIFAVLFVIAGAALIWFSIRSMRKESGKKESAQEEDVQEGDAQENLAQGNSVQEDSRQENSGQENSGQENSGQTDRTQEDNDWRDNGEDDPESPART
ncbi:MAG: hypothetical protein LIO76_09150 [Clostridiales bacterium]|nr:hypothetical protein [Clostridiales bacterium]